MWRPEARAWSLSAEQLHGRNGVIEEVAEAEHGTDQNTRESTTILKKKKKSDFKRYFKSLPNSLQKKASCWDLFMFYSKIIVC